MKGYTIRLVISDMPRLVVLIWWLVCSWATYSKGGFKEGVSLSVDDELNRWQKYAYGENDSFKFCFRKKKKVTTDGCFVGCSECVFYSVPAFHLFLNQLCQTIIQPLCRMVPQRTHRPPDSQIHVVGCTTPLQDFNACLSVDHIYPTSTPLY